ncbi:DUF5320 family protein, partial [Candidatus Aerophobetes bacterium]|nr:DUF5320 family protein [Candidatus Aerophobetes bacterium]
RFGRCRYFIIVDPETMQFEAIENPNIGAAGGAGIATAQMIAQKKVDAVITGNVGPNAFQTLSAAGIKIITGATGTVRSAIEKYKKGEFSSTSGPTVNAHFGMGGGLPGGGGRGFGRGMRRGMGPGMGWEAGYPGASYPGQMSPPPMGQISKQQELSMLKQQAQAIENQLEQIKKRIKELEKK